MACTGAMDSPAAGRCARLALKAWAGAKGPCRAAGASRDAVPMTDPRVYGVCLSVSRVRRQCEGSVGKSYTCARRKSYEIPNSLFLAEKLSVARGVLSTSVSAQSLASSGCWAQQGV